MKSENGQSLVEFALILPVLAMLLFGIVDFGRIFHAYLTIDHAGREAARAASVGKSKDEAEQIGKNAGSSINLTNVTVTAASSGKNATVVITYPITFLTPIIKNIVGEITLTDTTVMRVE
ncbi:TadE/TadG family type IV pilus assembly protein [Neobacillus mesonae]|uniref:TadE/TadG family type IV pilus assembly protein n=1 Tax=Neobacillus mesonae TaxID=1193713 RepID=UPI000A84689B|nr:TadE family protein [Neobacillus mesonae]